MRHEQEDEGSESEPCILVHSILHAGTLSKEVSRDERVVFLRHDDITIGLTRKPSISVRIHP